MRINNPILNWTIQLVFFALTITIFKPKGILAADSALRQYEKGNYPEAIRTYDRILKDHDDWEEAHFGKGAALYKSQRTEEAMREFEKAISVKDPLRKSAVYYNLGNALFQNGRLEESLAFYKKALEYNPRDFDAKYNYELARQIMQQQKNQDKNQSDQKSDQQNQSKDQSQPDQQSQPPNKEQQEQQAQQQQSQPNRHEKEKSQKEAAQILDALKNDEKKLMQERMRVKASGLAKEKDW
ncbi:MAG TPA: tetratricopeptide repeat protein [Candidatus Marinimicrobia bacterium]|nr:tetratricopeptide repeat protein [Candidatus Neomarinimicrobiota bacterium]HRS51849.1 tetratricopeptide repeat protein [Candidatus Neomarinimicrobiota bacterium]HRU92690.1 tetratricopeptide repeat protein [Candidatus Neomarinimicrobiota bacterium]